jgi:hypothetical protein
MHKCEGRFKIDSRASQTLPQTWLASGKLFDELHEEEHDEVKGS